VIRPHKRLDVWQKAVDLVTAIYTATDHFPSRENYGMSSQMRRAAVSVPSNIAEGAARSTDRDKVNFYHIARGSLSELDTQIEIAIKLKYLGLEEAESLQSMLDSVSRMLQGLIDSKRAQSLNHRIT
jgi:four helix bundle protein